MLEAYQRAMKANVSDLSDGLILDDWMQTCDS